MKKFAIILCILLGISYSLKATSSTFQDVQNFNHGYCPDCNCYPCRCNVAPPNADLAVPPTVPSPPGTPCAPCKKPDPCTPAPVCATQCGMSLCLIGGVIVVVAVTAAVVIGLNSGHVFHGPV